MEMIAHIITKNDKFISLSKEKTIAYKQSPSYEELSNDPSYIKLSSISQRYMEICLALYPHKYIYHIKEIFIKNVYVIRFEKNSIILETELIQLQILTHKEDQKAYISSLPDKYCKINNVFINRNLVIDESIVYKENIYSNKLDIAFSFNEEFHYVVNFKFKKSSVNSNEVSSKQYYSNKLDAEYFFNYNKIKNKENLIKSCK